MYAPSNIRPGKLFKIDSYRQYSLAAAHDENELSFHVKRLVERGDLKQRPGPDFQITGDSWARIGAIQASVGEKPNAFSYAAADLAVENHIVSVVSHGQSGGVTAHAVNIVPPASPERWWAKLWVIVVGGATIAGAVIAGLAYWDQKDHAADHSPPTPLHQTNQPNQQAPVPLCARTRSMPTVRRTITDSK